MNDRPIIKTIAIIFIAIIVTSVICVSISAISSLGNKEEQTTTTIDTTEDITESKVSEYQAQQIASDYLKQNDYKLYQSSNNHTISRIDMIEIATIEAEEQYSQYQILMKGRYWAYDEYGNVVGRYNFDATVYVDFDGYAHFGIVTHNKAY